MKYHGNHSKKTNSLCLGTSSRASKPRSVKIWKTNKDNTRSLPLLKLPNLKTVANSVKKLAK